MTRRKSHVGKSPIERRQYQRLIRSSQAEDPTAEEYESSTSDSVVREEAAKVSKIPPLLKPYKPSLVLPWKDIVIGLFILTIAGVFGYFAMTLNREVGVLSEKIESTKTDYGRMESNYNAVKKDVENIRVDIEIMKGRKRP